MKVKYLKRLLTAFRDDDDLCVLIWDKSRFDYDENDELELTDESWKKVCSEFDGMEFISVGEWISDSVMEYAETKEVVS